MVFGSHAKTRAIYSTPPWPSLAASTAAYRRRSFSDSHPKNRCIFCSTSAAYPSMPYSLLQNLLRRKDTTAAAIREVILDHILNTPLFITERDAGDLLYATYEDGTLDFSGLRKRSQYGSAFHTSDRLPLLSSYC